MSNTPRAAREAKYIDAIIRGLGKTDAAIAAGFSPSTAKHSVHRIHNRPRVQAAIQKAQEEVRKQAVYDTASALREIDSTILYAREKGSAISIAKLLDLKCRLCGLIVDRAHVVTETVDLRAALLESKARCRVINPSQLSGPMPLPNPFD